MIDVVSDLKYLFKIIYILNNILDLLKIHLINLKNYDFKRCECYEKKREI